MRIYRISLAVSTVFLIAVSLVETSVSAEPAKLRPERTITAAGMRVLEQVEPDLQKFVNQMERLPGQDQFIPVKINPEPATGLIWIDLGLGFMPRGQTIYDEGLGEKVREVNEELYQYIEGEITFLSIGSRIGGKSLNDWFPPVPAQKREAEKRSKDKANEKGTAKVPGLVIINPGHGRYQHSSTKTRE